MALKLVRIKLKDNLGKSVDDWAKFMNSNKPDIEKLLRAEGVSIEAYWLDHTESGKYLIGLMRSDDFAHSQKISNNSTSPIDEVHRKFQQDTWESVEKLEILLEVDTA